MILRKRTSSQRDKLVLLENSTPTAATATATTSCTYARHPKQGCLILLLLLLAATPSETFCPLPQNVHNHVRSTLDWKQHPTIRTNLARSSPNTNNDSNNNDNNSKESSKKSSPSNARRQKKRRDARRRKAASKNGKSTEPPDPDTSVLFSSSSASSSSSLQLESTLLPPPPPPSVDSEGEGHKRLHMKRGKDNNRRYYQLRDQPATPSHESQSKTESEASPKRPATSKSQSQPIPYDNQGSNSKDVPTNKNTGRYSSLLPPPTTASSSSSRGNSNPNKSSGLSSWEDFLGSASFMTSPSTTTASTPATPSSVPPLPKTTSTPPPSLTEQQSTAPKAASEAPPHRETRPPQRKQKERLRKGAKARTKTKMTESSSEKTLATAPKSLPNINDLFPSSESSLPSSRRRTDALSRMGAPTSSRPLRGVLPVSDLFYHASSSSSSSLDTTGHPKAPANVKTGGGGGESNNTINSDKKPSSSSSKKKKTGRKMVRRGMEMLVGGVPISADPPQRAVEIFYEENLDAPEWPSVVGLNTLDFGPFLDRNAASALSKYEQGLFCEYFVNNTMKWHVCPEDLKQVVKNYDIGAANDEDSQTRSSVELKYDTEEEDDDDDLFGPPDHIPTHDEEDEEDGMISVIVRPHRTIGTESGKITHWDDDDMLYEFHLGTTEIGIAVEKSLLISSGEDPDEIMKFVLLNGVTTALEDLLQNSTVSISHFAMSEMDDGSTRVAADFVVQCIVLAGAPDEELVENAKNMVDAFTRATDGDISLAAANAAREETRWNPEVRELVVEEFLDGEDNEDDDDEEDQDQEDETTTAKDNKSNSVELNGDKSVKEKEPQNQLEKEQGLILDNRELILPQTTLETLDWTDSGLSYNCSLSNVFNAPFRGEIGLRLVDAVVERAKQRQPRVIVVGDVHGCIDELQDLLRECDYRPGDLVVFLGDLVCKGPDSIAVVQMAREIGAIGVRGNHDFEVIRWHRAIKAGVDPPALRSEHFHIASCLSKADVQWLHNLPWYLSSKDLGALFVHAGFVSGIRLAKQNPRLMMNMRSILPDGTVTSKFFNNWPWARLWDGSQTVFFGHDADRGLQQYDQAIGLDTGCVYGGRLTACILPERKLVSVSARREYFKYRRKHYD